MITAIQPNYRGLAKYYDLMYAWKNYEQESKIVQNLIQKYKKSNNKRLLEVGCGTGQYLAFFQQGYEVAGLDLSKDMLTIANSRFPKIPFFQGNMMDFQLETTFDVILCLFSSIAYVKNYQRLTQTLQNFYNHLNTGGLLIFDLFVNPDKYVEGLLFALNVDEPDIKISRHNISKRKGNLATFDFHTLVTTPKGIEYFQEHHELGLFEDEKVKTIMEKVGFDIQEEAVSLVKDRSLFLGIK